MTVVLSKTAQKFNRIFGLLLEENLLPRASKNHQIWSHWLGGLLPQSIFELPTTHNNIIFNFLLYNAHYKFNRQILVLSQINHIES